MEKQKPAKDNKNHIVIISSLLKDNLTPEQLLILSCSKQLVTDAAAGAIEDLLTQSLDWDFVLSMGNAHGIAGLLFMALSQSCSQGAVPDAVLKKLEKTYHHNALQNLFFLREFNVILKNFEHEGIKIIPLKGIALLHSIYGRNIGLRSLSDIDLLVEKQNVSRAEKIFAEMGYTRKKTSLRNRRRGFHAIFSSRGEIFPVVIELHWDVDYSDSPFKIAIEEFWARSEQSRAREGLYYQLSREDNIIFSSFHIVREIKKGPDILLSLKNFCDIGILLQQYGDHINWDSVIRRSRNYSVLRPVGFVLLLVRELLGVATIPPAVINALRCEGCQDDFLCSAVTEYVFPSPAMEKKILPFWLIELASQKTLKGKLRVFLSLPKIIMNLYGARYYGALNYSTLRTTASVISYYIRKTVKTAVLYVTAPKKTFLIQKSRRSADLKTREIIQWIRG